MKENIWIGSKLSLALWFKAMYGSMSSKDSIIAMLNMRIWSRIELDKHLKKYLF